MISLPTNAANRLRRAFTLTEVMLAFALLAMAAAVLIPNFSGMLTSNREREAKSKASLINLAKSAYVRDYGQAAFTTWAQTPSDADRFLLLKEQLGPACSDPTLSDFTPQGYTFTLGTLTSGVAIVGPDGPVAY